MKTSLKPIIIGALGSATCLVLSAGNVQAQDRPPQGNFDPSQMRQRMLDRMREQFEVTDNTEWKAISERIEKVMQARRSAGGMGGPGMFGMPGGRGGPDGPGGPGGPGVSGGPGGRGGQGGQFGPGGGQGGFGPPDRGPQGAQSMARGGGPGQGGPGGPPGFARESNPDLDALRKALDSKASASEIKAKLAAYREARKKKEADLEKAQDELREILSARQEAIAVTIGLLK